MTFQKITKKIQSKYNSDFQFQNITCLTTQMWILEICKEFDEIKNKRCGCQQEPDYDVIGPDIEIIQEP